jgi:hypothetical protein
MVCKILFIPVAHPIVTKIALFAKNKGKYYSHFMERITYRPGWRSAESLGGINYWRSIQQGNPYFWRIGSDSNSGAAPQEVIDRRKFPRPILPPSDKVGLGSIR